MHNLNYIKCKGFVAGDHLQMIVTGGTTNAATTQKGAPQIRALAVVRAQQRILQIALHAQQLQLVQCFCHLRRGNNVHLVAIILFQAPGASNDNLRLHLIIIFEHMQHASC